MLKFIFYFSKCCFNVTLCRTRYEFGKAVMFRSQKLKNKEEKCKKSRKKFVGSQDGLNNWISYVYRIRRKEEEERRKREKAERAKRERRCPGCDMKVIRIYDYFKKLHVTCSLPYRSTLVGNHDDMYVCMQLCMYVLCMCMYMYVCMYVCWMGATTW